MRKRYIQIAAALKAEAGITQHTAHKKMTGRASLATGAILAPAGTTRRQLYVLAHECGHIALHSALKSRRKPRHVEEHEAESYAHRARSEASTYRARWYVGECIEEDRAKGIRSARWPKPSLWGGFRPMLRCLPSMPSGVGIPPGLRRKRVLRAATGAAANAMPTWKGTTRRGGAPAITGEAGVPAPRPPCQDLALPVQILAFTEGVLPAEKSGMPRETAVDVLLNTIAASPMLQYRGPLVLKMPDEAWFNVNMMQKDMLHALKLGRQVDVPLPTTSLANEILTSARAMSLAERDFAIIFQVLERMSGVSK